MLAELAMKLMALSSGGQKMQAWKFFSSHASRAVRW